MDRTLSRKNTRNSYFFFPFFFLGVDLCTAFLAGLTEAFAALVSGFASTLPEFFAWV